jgi:hypothetical protein
MTRPTWEDHQQFRSTLAVALFWGLIGAASGAFMLGFLWLIVRTVYTP